MPGPCNSKKGKKVPVKKNKQSKSVIQITAPQELPPLAHALEPPSRDIASSCGLPQIRPTQFVQDLHDDVLPSIHDPGNGPRVRDVRAFLSSFFAQPPSLDDPLCAEFSQEEVLQMLCTSLPEDTAIVSAESGS